MNKEITALLEQGYTLLTPTMRMSRYLRNQYATQQINSGKKVWESADILPWQTWVHRFWDNYFIRSGEIPLRLNPSQRQSIWLQLIEASDFAEYLLQPLSVAKQAVRAWELSHHWQLPLFAEGIHINHDVRAFQSWAHSYQQLCQKHAWLDDACLPEFLIEQLQADHAPVNLKLLLFGHDQLYPQQQSLLDALQRAGAEIRVPELENQNQRVVGAGFVDVGDEINAAANWAGRIMQSEPGTSIGIVVPDLQKLRLQIQDQFDDVLLAGGILEPADPLNRPYSISLGQSLNSYPLIASAFLILNLVEHALSVQELGLLLHSPFIKAAGEEQGKRAILDAVLREYGEQYLSISSLDYIAKNHIEEEQQCLGFLQCMEAWQASVKKLPASQTAHAWVETFSALLSDFAWPGERPLSSTEFQTMTAWQELLSQFVSLDVVNTPVAYRTALSQLRQLAAGFSFQPETAEVPIQIMALTGTAGMHLDHLWVLGLHEEAWPLAAEPDPFIPLVLQRQHKLPYASAELRLAWSRQMTDRLLQSAVDVLVSYPENDKDRPLRPSPPLKLLLQGPDNPQIDRVPDFKKLIFNSREFDYVEDNTAPAISSGDRVRGGAGLFKDQAACPFRAFARHRLHASALASTDIGLNAMERGSLLHDVMQIFWQRISSHAELLALSDEQQDSLLDSSIKTALKPYTKQRPRTFTERFSLLERQRLKIILRDWLEVEKQRQAFEVVACEQKHEFTFADIEVRTRIDRIDKIPDGRYVILDYKTGEVSLSAWFDERPDDPQLPLYAISTERKTAALAYAKIKCGDTRFIGIADEDEILPAVKSFEKVAYVNELSSWSELLARWSGVLLSLAGDFRQGRAEVNPKNDSSCRYCDLHALCRIHELAQDIPMHDPDSIDDYE